MRVAEGSSRSFRAAAFVVLVAVIAAACSSNASGGGGTGGSDSTLTATVDGSSFKSTLTGASFSGGDLHVAGRVVAGDMTRQIDVYAFGISGPGTYDLGQQPLNFATYTETTNGNTLSWSSSFAGAAGSITVTELTATHTTGTFTYTAPAATHTGSTGTRTVTNGTFSLILGTP